MEDQLRPEVPSTEVARVYFGLIEHPAEVPPDGRLEVVPCSVEWQQLPWSILGNLMLGFKPSFLSNRIQGDNQSRYLTVALDPVKPGLRQHQS